ncbi:DMT family transporter [Aurantiacibacter aquimixticola]|uniref:DMT family transporter n=1 Tax=Aurantiacibacter aquimixticola TaxID=1958945 RepID=A0A419RR27_9SPHN|nr:DMT family transporter [Aurantiacibacter aquimixticola]RJY08235.1 DMT family transporter [Aurantiacibacter aquimixticola]
MQQSDRAGLLFALAGFTLLSIGDTVVKSMADEWTPSALAAVRYTLGAVGLSALLMAREGTAPLRTVPKPAIQAMRGLGVGIATLAFFASVWVMPLADAVAITFTQPMITALLAAFFLGERLRASTLGATVVAFVGVLIILRPNFAEIGWAAVFPLICATGMAVLMTANRAARGAGSALAAQAYVAIGGAAVLVTAAAIGHFSGYEQLRFYWPEWHVLARTAFVAVSASTAHWLVFMGTERAGASTIAPMTYIQILVASTLAWIFFDEVPDLIAIGGAGLIIASGLWLWRQGQKRAADTEHP